MTKTHQLGLLQQKKAGTSENVVFRDSVPRPGFVAARKKQKPDAQANTFFQAATEQARQRLRSLSFNSITPFHYASLHSIAFIRYIRSCAAPAICRASKTKNNLDNLIS